MPAHVGAHVLQHADQQERGRDAVGVVVAVYGDGFVPRERPVDAPACVGHPLHEIGIVHAIVGVEEGARHGGLGEAAPHEHLGEDFAHAQLVD